MRDERPAIAIFSAFYPPHLGGIERFVRSLAGTLEARDVHAIVVTSASEGAPDHEVQEDGVEVFRIPGSGLLGGRLPVPSRSRAASVLDELERAGVSGVLVNARFYPLSLLGARFARRIGVRPVVLDHSSGYVGFGVPVVDQLAHRYEHAMTRRLASCGSLFYGVSEMSRAWLTTFGVPGVGVIHNAIDADEFRSLASGRDFRAELGIASDDLVVAFTGRLLRQKGLSELAETARLLAGTNPRVRVLVAGDGPDRRWLEERVPRNLSLLGSLDRPDLSALLRQSDVFLFPSTYPEGMPTSLLEAAACGLACVATDVGGVREIVPDDSCGIVVDEPRPEVLAEVVRSYDADRALVAAQGERVRAHVEGTLTWEATADAVVAACEAARREAPAPGSVSGSGERSYPPEVLERLQRRELELLRAVDGVCRAEGLTYFLASGSCLGAIRHGGFIPWDDDIDVGMPVADYRRFLEVAPSLLPEGVSLHTADNTPGAPFLWAKLFLDGTRFIETDSVQAGLEQGIFLDVFPYFRLDDDDRAARAQYGRGRRLQLLSYLHCLGRPSGVGKGLAGRARALASAVAHATVARPFSPVRLRRDLDRVLSREGDGSRLIDFSGGRYVPYPEDCLFPVRECSFDGVPTFVPHDPDRYLTILFGDYMKLPDPEDRHTHTPVILDLGDGVDVMSPGGMSS